MKDKLLKIFDEILSSEILYFSLSEETLFPDITWETKKSLRIDFKEKRKEEKKITEKQLNLLRKILSQDKNKKILTEKFQIDPKEIEKISMETAKEILSFFMEEANAKK
ncbi:MAG: hypothetical protein ACP5I0_09330 [Dictyoglomus sp.]|uniref:hypothetical protein n=1 Tax=Dictyoglomus sp. TaxID=28205 RepID=UPI003D1022F3